MPPINYVTQPKVGMATAAIPFPKISMSPGTTTPILLSLDFDPYQGGGKYRSLGDGQKQGAGRSHDRKGGGTGGQKPS